MVRSGHFYFGMTLLFKTDLQNRIKKLIKICLFTPGRSSPDLKYFLGQMPVLSGA
jgi:hypothetical protein